MDMPRWYCRIVAGLSLLTIWGAGAYYAYQLNYAGISGAVFATVVSFIILKGRLNCNVREETDSLSYPPFVIPSEATARLDSPSPARRGRSVVEESRNAGIPKLLALYFMARDPSTRPQTASLRMTMIVTFLLCSALNFYILYHSRTAESIISPWQAVPWYFFLTFTVTTATLVLYVLVPRSPAARERRGEVGLLITCYFFQLVSVALLVYAVGYGFDPFIHQATETLIAKTGAVYPKPFYYLGQYALVVIIHTLTFIPIAWLDKLLVPVLAAILLPPAVLAAVRSLICHCEERFFERRGNPAIVNQHGLAALRSDYIGTPLTMTASLTTLLLAILPFSLFIVTTPQNLSYLFLVLLIVFSLVTYNLSLVTLLALAALAVHPLTGIPALFFVAAYAAGQAPRFRSALTIAIAIASSLAVPAALLLNNLTSPVISAAAETGANLSFHFPWPFLSGLENIILTASYLYGFNNSYLLAFLIIIGGVIAIRRRLETLIPYAALAAAMLVSSVLTRSVDVSYLITYERSAFADRLITIAIIYTLPFILLALAAMVRRVLQQETAVRALLLAFGALLITASLYHSYPRFDHYFNSRSYSTSAADVEAVRWIERDAAGRDYVVLANQQVSAAALQELGFKKYYETPAGPVFLYPIPTGERLYQYYLDMVYKEANKKTAREAAELAGVDRVYFVLNNYWWAFDKIRAEAELEADQSHSVANGAIYLFSYTF